MFSNYQNFIFFMPQKNHKLNHKLKFQVCAVVVVFSIFFYICNLYLQVSFTKFRELLDFINNLRGIHFLHNLYQINFLYNQYIPFIINFIICSEINALLYADLPKILKYFKQLH